MAMKKEKIFDFAIDNPLTPMRRKAIEQNIAHSAHLSAKPLSYRWDESDDGVLHIEADPVLIEVRFQDKNVALYGAAPLWARLMFTEKRKAELKERFESALQDSDFFAPAPAAAERADQDPRQQEKQSARPAHSSGARPANAASAAIDQQIVRIAPGNEGVSIWSPALFSDRAGSNIREFLSRVFSVNEVAAVEIRRSESFGRVRYDSSANAREIWLKLSHALRQSAIPQPAIAGYAGLNLGDVDNLYLAGPPGSPIRVNRVDASLSTWRLRHQTPERVRLTHPILRNRKDVAYRLEEELAAIHGVEEFRTNLLTASVAIRFNPRALTVERLIRQLEKCWPRLLEGLDGPPSSKRLVAAGGLLGLAFTGQYLIPPLRPLAVLGVAIYGAPNVLNAGKQLVHRQVGLPALYSAGLAFMLWGGMPFSSTVIAVLMQFWPRLAFQTMAKSQRRLFASHRRSATWAHVLQSDGLEIEVDIDSLRPGDLIAVRGGEIVPVDGVVTQGLAAVDEEALSGAPGAVDKTLGDKVYSNTFVRDGRLTVRVEKIGADTVAGYIGACLPHARIDHLPSSAEAERIANRNAKPALALAGVALLATRIARPAQAILRPDYATAPRLSAQLTALHDLGDGLHQGIFFRDPAALDRLPATDIYVFDDASGLERRRIEVADVIPTGAVSADVILAYATAAFKSTQNGRARALLAQSLKRGTPIPEVKQRTRHAGAVRYRDSDNQLIEVAAPAYLGAAGGNVSALIADAARAAQRVSNPRPDADWTASITHEEPHLRPIWVIRDGETLGAVTFRRQGELEAIETIAALKARNKRAQFVHISSRPQAMAEAIAGRAGVSTVFGDLDPAGKARALKNLGRRTMWIGDGASPAARPSIEASTVSISVAGVSTAVFDTADILFLQPGLQNLVPLRRIARRRRAHIEADYRAVYAANLLGVAGGLFGAFSSPALPDAAGGSFTGFGSLEAGLTSNAGTAFVFARHWIRMHNLISKVETRRAVLDSLAYEDSDHLPATRPSNSDETEIFVDYRDPHASVPLGAALNGV